MAVGAAVAADAKALIESRHFESRHFDWVQLADTTFASTFEKFVEMVERVDLQRLVDPEQRWTRAESEYCETGRERLWPMFAAGYLSEQ